MEFVLPTMKMMIFVGIGTIVLGLIILSGIAWGRRHKLNYIVGSVICVAIGIYILAAKGTGTIRVEEDHLVLKAALSKTQLINVDKIKRAWIQDLEDSKWTPTKKNAGTAIGNIRTGWFTLKNGRKAYLVLQGMKAICIEADAEHVFLFGVKDFDDFLIKIKAQMPPLAEILETH
jgi:hypothetical protein